MLTIFAGRRTSTGCNRFPAAGFITFTDESEASWVRLDDTDGNGPSGDADKTGGGDQTQRFGATAPGLKGTTRPDCAIADVNEAGNAANIYDTLGPFTLKGLPSLALRVRNVPKQQLKLGQSRHLRITVTNTGDGTARGVKLSLARRRGLRSTPRTRTIGTLYSGRRKTVTVKVTLVRGASGTTEVPITAAAGDLRAKTEIKLRRRAKKSTSSGGGGSGSSTSPLPRLCSRYQGYPNGGGALILVPC